MTMTDRTGCATCAELRRENEKLREALKTAHGALTMLVTPATVSTTTTMVAFLECIRAEKATRAALEET
jgi:hypothetical protein